jgi:hypothetical protein
MDNLATKGIPISELKTYPVPALIRDFIEEFGLV